MTAPITVTTHAAGLRATLLADDTRIGHVAATTLHGLWDEQAVLILATFGTDGADSVITAYSDLDGEIEVDELHPRAARWDVSWTSTDDRHVVAVCFSHNEACTIAQALDAAWDLIPAA